ncbi:unnamed protein product [Camellia sinensis]
MPPLSYSQVNTQENDPLQFFFTPQTLTRRGVHERKPDRTGSPTKRSIDTCPPNLNQSSSLKLLLAEECSNEDPGRPLIKQLNRAPNHQKTETTAAMQTHQGGENGEIKFIERKNYQNNTEKS